MKLQLGLLLAGLTLNQLAFAGDAGVSGNGCAIAKDGAEINITNALTGAQIHNITHGNLVAGTIIPRTATFAYDLTDEIDTNCAFGLLELSLAERNHVTKGAITLQNIEIKDDKGRILTSDLSTNNKVTLGNTRAGSITITTNYIITTPSGSLLAQNFSYEDSFDLLLTTKKTTTP